jgi:hypothetical protein
MFNRTTIQMLQGTLNLQGTLDEIHGQIWNLQMQVMNITNSFDEFEERMFLKLQDSRPTIFTSDVVPLDDVLEVISTKLGWLHEVITD